MTGWLWLSNAAHDLLQRRGSPAVKIYLALCSFADGETPGVERAVAASVDRIQARTGLSRRAVQMGVRELTEAGLLAVSMRRAPSGMSRVNEYTILVASPAGEGAPECASPPGNRAHSDAPRGAPGCAEGAHQGAPNQRPSLFQDLSLQKKPEGAGEPPPGLIELLEGWTALPAGIVKSGNGARCRPPAKATLAGWNKAQKEPEQRDVLANIPALLAAIKRADFCHGQGWFSVPWLFGKNKHGEFNLVRLVDGAHENNGNGRPKQTVGPGQRHRDDATRSGF